MPNPRMLKADAAIFDSCLSKDARVARIQAMTQALTRSLSRTQLIFYGVGTIVGAGIYTIIGSAAGLAGTAL